MDAQNECKKKLCGQNKKLYEIITIIVWLFITKMKYNRKIYIKYVLPL